MTTPAIYVAGRGMFCLCTGGVYLMTHVHLIGIGGTGISSIARVLLEKGYTVSGSDRTLSPLAHDLMQAGVTVFEGHAAENIVGADLVVRSSAIADDNIEVIAARDAGIPVQKRAEFLNTLLSKYQTLAVVRFTCKTTTSTMLAGALTSWVNSLVSSSAVFPATWASTHALEVVLTS